MHFRRRLGLLVLPVALAFSGSWSEPAVAAPSFQEKSRAKQEWVRGRQMMARGRFDQAAEHYRKASELHPKAQHTLDLARALEKLGKLLEASQLLHQVVTTSESNAGLAQAAAQKLVIQVEPRVPWILIEIKGPPRGAAETTVDGEVVDASVEAPLDPGEHTIVVEADGFVPAEKTIELEESAHETIKLVLEPLGDSDEGDEVQEDDDGGGSVVPAVIAFGVGVVGIGVGGVFGAMAFSETSEVEERCGGNKCPPSEAQALDDAKAKGTISTIGFVVGGVGLATGVVLLLMSGGDSEEQVGLPSVRPFVGVGSIGASGTF